MPSWLRSKGGRNGDSRADLLFDHALAKLNTDSADPSAFPLVCSICARSSKVSTDKESYLISWSAESLSNRAAAPWFKIAWKSTLASSSWPSCCLLLVMPSWLRFREGRDGDSSENCCCLWCHLGLRFRARGGTSWWWSSGLVFCHTRWLSSGCDVEHDTPEAVPESSKVVQMTTCQCRMEYTSTSSNFTQQKGVWDPGDQGQLQFVDVHG